MGPDGSKTLMIKARAQPFLKETFKDIGELDEGLTDSLRKGKPYSQEKILAQLNTDPSGVDLVRAFDKKLETQEAHGPVKQGGRNYLLNTLIVPVDFGKFSRVRVSFKRIDVETAKRILSRGFISAVGHEATAKLLSKVLGLHVPLCRDSVFMEKGDKAVHFFLKKRLPEGAVLGEEELAKLDYWLILSEVEETVE